MPGYFTHFGFRGERNTGIREFVSEDEYLEYLQSMESENIELNSDSVLDTRA